MRRATCATRRGMQTDVLYVLIGLASFALPLGIVALLDERGLERRR